MSYLETRYSSNYRPDPAFYQFKAKRLMGFIRSLDTKQRRSFVDLGCGCGDLAESMHKEFKLDVAGVERDETMTHLAQEKKVGEFHSGNLLIARPEWKGRFDIVNSFEVFEHLSHDEHKQALALYKAYGAKDSIGVIMVPNAAHPLLGGWLSWSDYTHRTCFTPESLGQMLRETGVTQAKIFPWYTAGSSRLLRARTWAGNVGSRLLKIVAGTLNTMPFPQDSFFNDALPLSSHLIAVFGIPND
jgi:hypothetical protein